MFLARVLLTIKIWTACLLAASPAGAQMAASDQVRSAPPRTPRGPLFETGMGWRAFVVFDRVEMEARKAFEAVTGSSALSAVGGGGEVRVWKGLFGRLAVSTSEATGTRGFVVQGQFVSTGIPMTVEVTPLEVGAGWRLPLGRSRRLVAYGGAGILRVQYKETSDFAGEADNVDRSNSGSVVFGGVDVRISRWLMTGVEVQRRTVTDAFGGAGIGAGFDEKGLGGVVVRLLVGIRR